MILVDRGARTLGVGLLDLVDAGTRGVAFREERDATRERLEAEARAAFVGEARAGVELGAEVDWNGWRVALDGRADVLRASSRGARVEALCFAHDADPEAAAARAAERAGFAALLLALSGERVAGAAVVTLSLAGESPRRKKLAFSAEAWAERLWERLVHIAAGAELESERGEQRRAFAPPFPFEAPRAAQQELLREVEGAARSGLILLCSAPTGVGKTAAALHPFLVDALREDRRVFFVTSKTSQQELALETLGAMLPAGCGALAVQIAAKDRVCPQRELGCAERRCPWQRRFAERLAATGLADELADAGVLSAARIGERARERELCPFETSLALAERSSAVVCDYNYVFDPRVALRRFFDASSGRDLLVVDEAHNLPQRAQGYFSPELELAKLDALAARCATLSAPAYASAGALLAEVSAHCRAQATRLGEERGDDAPWVEEPERGFFEEIEARAALAQLETQAQAATERARPPELAPVAEGREGRLRDPLQTALALVRDFARGAGSDDPARFAALWSTERAKRLCLDPAPWLGRRIKSFHAAVLMSATLAPLDFHARALGVDGPRAVSLDLPSPFPRENRRILVVDSVDTRFRARAEQAGAIAEQIARGVRTRRGNWLAFFPSYAFRDEVVAKLPPGEARLLLQMPGLPAEPILARLRANTRETLLVCGVQGGVLAEGVDYPGEMAIGVFVVGPGLPKVERERELMRAFFDAELGEGFEHAYLLPGLARAVQSAGRALRGPDDVAAIVLLDRRFAEPLYRERLPAWWREELAVVPDCAPALEVFWRERGRNRADSPSSRA